MDSSSKLMLVQLEIFLDSPFQSYSLISFPTKVLPSSTRRRLTIGTDAPLSIITVACLPFTFASQRATLGEQNRMASLIDFGVDAKVPPFIRSNGPKIHALRLPDLAQPLKIASRLSWKESFRLCQRISGKVSCSSLLVYRSCLAREPSAFDWLVFLPAVFFSTTAVFF